jgi:hypothetical protein
LYGLIPPDQVIAPYDMSLMGAGRGQQRIWASKVLQQLADNLEPGSRIVLLAGRDYTQFIAGSLRQMGHVVDEPLAGLRQGEQLATLRLLANESIDSDSAPSSPEPRGPANRQGMVVDNLHVDVERARHVVEYLYSTFAGGGSGIFGERSMPEDILPAGLSQGSREHINFLTLTISVDYMRDALELWRSARRAWSEAGTRYLFEPSIVEQTAIEQLRNDLVRTGIALRPTRDGNAWSAISRTLSRKWNADVKSFLSNCGFHGPTILARLHSDGESSALGWAPDFPLLRGPKIGPLWVRTLRDNALLELSGLENVPIPVDVHVMRATLCSGAIRGRYSGSPEKLKHAVRDVWRIATKDLRHPDGRSMIPLDIDEPLWTLSRLGCSSRGNGALAPCPLGCPLAPGCVDGFIKITATNSDINIAI